MHMIETVIDEPFVVFTVVLFRQICGVPMGGNASPMLADLCPSFMEYEFAKNLHNEQITTDLLMTYL